MMLTVLLIACAVIQSHAQTEEGKKAEEMELQMTAASALLKYGWATPSQIGQLTSANSPVFQDDLMEYQNFAGIAPTGEVDDATIQMLKKSRCGDRDPKSKKRQRRYNHQGSVWKDGLHMKLRWRLFNSGRTVSHDDARGVLTRAFKLWSDVTNLKFTETPNEDEPEIKVKFVRYSHGDPYAFDGEGGVLAHAFYPHNNLGRSGDVHFDDDEYFSANRKPSHGEKDMMWVAVHEIGHSIGLEHSHNQDAIMYPWYNTKYNPDIQLKYDDKLGIQLLYGGKDKPQPSTIAPTKPTTQKPTTSKPTTPTTAPSESTTPPKPTVPECKNLAGDDWCANLRGNCDVKSIKKVCQKQCGICKTNECFDLQSSAICKAYIRLKHCQNHKATAKKYCAKSCNLCT